jgi:secreted trypsin-like serine protease
VAVLTLRLGAVLVALGLLVSPALAIFGGKPVVPGSAVAATVAAILDQTGDGAQLCTAVTLAPRLLLTAAHCTQGGPRGMRVVFSTTLANVPPDRLRGVTAVARASRTAAARGTYAYNNPDDLALIVLDAPAPPGTAFARLATADPAGAATLRVAGYGATSELRKPDAQGRRQFGFDRILRSTTVPLLSSGPALLVTDQRQGVGTCTGDSGGPLLTAADGPPIVVGIMVGASSPRAVNDYCRGRAYFAAIPRWRDWIVSAAAGFGQKL